MKDLVKLTILTGPKEGQSRFVHSRQVEPMGLLQSIVNKGWEWKLDYSDADPSESFFWIRADMVVRIIRALRAGRSVFFLEQEYRFQEGGDPEKVVGEIEDAISESGFNVYVETDNEQGVRIGTAGPEEGQPIH